MPSTRRDLPIALGVTAVVVGLVAAIGLWGAERYGPRYGLYLTPPSPARYAEIALEYLDTGLYAEGEDWERARADLVAAGQEADDIADLYPALSEATDVSGGRHSRFLTPDEAQTSAGLAVATFEPPTVTTSDGVTTVVLPALGPVPEDEQRQYAESASQAIAHAAEETCGWIVDLRGNTGGDMFPMLSAVSALLPNGPAMTFVSRDGGVTTVSVADDGGALEGATVTPVTSVPKIDGRPIAVLQDSQTASSGEAVAVAFRGLDRVQSFGPPSAGYTSANTAIPLYDGAVLVLTTSVYVDRDGVSLDEEPIEADVSTPGGLSAPDAAAGWLQTQGCD